MKVKKTLGIFLLGTLLLFCACVDETYDLNKKIATDIEIEGNKLAFPLGSLQAFMLDSLLGSVELIDTTENGEYCIQRYDTLSTEMHILPIDLNISPKSITKEIVISNPFVAGGRQTGKMDLPAIPFEINEDFSFRNKFSNQFLSIYGCTFKEEMAIRLSIELEGLEALQATSAGLDFTIDFPLFLCNLRSSDEGVSINKNHVHITKEYLAKNSQGIHINLYCSSFDFEKEAGEYGLAPLKGEDGHTYLAHSSRVTATGQIQINDANPTATEPEFQIAMRLNLSLAPSSVKTVDGVFTDKFETTEFSYATDLGEQLKTFIAEGNDLKLAEPRIEVELYNTITVPLENVELNLQGRDKEGETILPTVIEAKFDINPAQVDEITEEIIVDTTKWLLTTNTTLDVEGFDIIETPNLENWLECAPDSMHYSVYPIVMPARRDIRIDQSIGISAAYKAVIPLKFSTLHIVYSDTIPVSLDLNESDETLTNLGLKLKMNVANTVPLGLEIAMVALDENSNPIDDISIESMKVKPCNEAYSTLQNTLNVQEVLVGIDGNDFSKFDKLKFDIKIYSQEGDVTLRTTQGIQISDMAIIVTGDIKTNLNKP